MYLAKPSSAREVRIPFLIRMSVEYLDLVISERLDRQSPSVRA